MGLVNIAEQIRRSIYEAYGSAADVDACEVVLPPMVMALMEYDLLTQVPTTAGGGTGCYDKIKVAGVTFRRGPSHTETKPAETR